MVDFAFFGYPTSSVIVFNGKITESWAQWSVMKMVSFLRENGQNDTVDDDDIKDEEYICSLDGSEMRPF